MPQNDAKRSAREKEQETKKKVVELDQSVSTGLCVRLRERSCPSTRDPESPAPQGGTARSDSPSATASAPAPQARDNSGTRPAACPCPRPPARLTCQRATSDATACIQLIQVQHRDRHEARVAWHPDKRCAAWCRRGCRVARSQSRRLGWRRGGDGGPSARYG